MDAYEAFNALFDRLVKRQEHGLDEELEQLLELDPKKWAELYEHLRSLIETPLIGTPGQQAQAFRAKWDYLVDQASPNFPQVIGRLLARANRHYTKHQVELDAVRDQFAGRDEATAKTVE